MDWQSSPYSRSPTVSGFLEALALFPCPENIATTAESNKRWKSALISLLAHDLHTDGNHFPLDGKGSFHPLTVDHYHTGTSKYGKSTQTTKYQNWQARSEHIELILRNILDLCTLLDRLTGGSTLFLHHPGAVPPKSSITPQMFNAHVYVNPKVLAEHPELHAVIAQISQLFTSHYATPLAESFATSCYRAGWSSSSTSSTQQAYPQANRMDDSKLPLVPPPITPASSHFVIPGRPMDTLHRLLSSNTQLLSYLPKSDAGHITWAPAQVPVIQCGTSKAGSASASAKKPDSRRQLKGDTLVQFTATRTNTENTCMGGPSLTRSGDYYFDCDAEPSHDAEPSMPVAERIMKTPVTEPVVRTMSMGRAYPPSSSGLPFDSGVQPLVSFGTEMEDILEDLGYPDTFHRVCVQIQKDFLPKRWVAKLQDEPYRVPKDHAEMIGEAMLTDAKYQEVQAVLNYLEMKATELALKFKQPCCRYLEWFSLGSVPHRRKRNKTSAWHAFLHFKGADNGRSNIVDLVKDKAEYHSLKKAEKETLIKEFDQVKASASQRPPTITAHSRAAECARSFQFVKEELDALKQRVGVEAIVFMVRGVSDFTMAPKAFFSSAAAEQFVRLYLRKDIAQLATEFESTILANGVILTSAMNHRDRVSKAKASIRLNLRVSLCELTGDEKASVEFTHYEDRVVQRYLVKLVGWNHPQWVNPSDLKGGIDTLEKVAEALSKGTCRFVKITQDEVEERQRRIAAGEKLTPELEPPVPLDDIPEPLIPLDNIPEPLIPLDNIPEPLIPLDNILPSAATGQATQADCDPVDNTLSTEAPLPTEDQSCTTEQSSLTQLVHTSPSTNSSSIRDDLINPVLRASDNLSVTVEPSPTSPPMSPPPTPPVHTPAGTLSQTPITTAEGNILTATTNSRKRVQVEPSGGQSGRQKRAWKLTERGLAFWDDPSRDSDDRATSGRRKKQRVSKKKSSVLVTSEQENA
ncbi:hypothetical protein F4604DRAFT_1689370 [Suillus subluteus]|nr:hypothetical protein F4604DRAFT_1689370 [Suillus subluteus]